MQKKDDQECMSDAFMACWQAAGVHLDAQIRGGIQSWLKAMPYPPFLEHLSFRLGNQLFFVRVEDAKGRVQGPGSLQDLQTVARGCQGFACRLPMRKKILGPWVPVHPGWGLVDAESGYPVNPVDLLTSEKIPMTEWERQDFAVQVVRTYLENQGFKLLSWQGNPAVDPAIWFVGHSRRPEWVVVRACSYPQRFVSRPSAWASIAEGCSAPHSIGHFASVALTSARQPMRSETEAVEPLWRGHALQVRFDGLQ